MRPLHSSAFALHTQSSSHLDSQRVRPSASFCSGTLSLMFSLIVALVVPSAAAFSFSATSAQRQCVARTVSPQMINLFGNNGKRAAAVFLLPLSKAGGACV